MHDDDHFLPFVYYISWWVLVGSSQIGSRESAEKVRRGENVGTRTVHPALIAEGQRAEMLKKKNARTGLCGTATPSSVTSTGVLRHCDDHGGSLGLSYGGWSGLSFQL